MFQDKLKELREKAELSQQALADKLFVSRSAIAKWENGNGIPSDVNLEAICSLFQISRNDLFGDEMISEFRETKNIKNKYKNGLIISLILSSLIIVLICSFYIVQEHKYEQEYERFKKIMRKELNTPVESFGNIDERYLNIIDSKILYNDRNVFLNEKDFYVVNKTTSLDIVEIKRYDYEFEEIGTFQLFLHNGYNANIVDIRTLNNGDVLVSCNHSTYYNECHTYNGYSTITKFDNSYKVKWEYTFVNEEHYIESVFEYNNQYYIFTTINKLDDVSVTMRDAKIYILSNDGKIEKEENITLEFWGSILSVRFENEIFFIGYLVQEKEDTSIICKTFEYDTNLNCINSYEDNDHWNLKQYKSSNGLVYYNSEPLKINDIHISSRYGRLVLCLNIKNEKLLVFKNVIDYDWENCPKYVSHIPEITQTIYLLLDKEGKILWCKSE